MTTTEQNAVEIIRLAAETYGLETDIIERIAKMQEVDESTGAHPNATNLDYYLWALEKCAQNDSNPNN